MDLFNVVYLILLAWICLFKRRFLYSMFLSLTELARHFHTEDSP